MQGRKSSYFMADGLGGLRGCTEVDSKRLRLVVQVCIEKTVNVRGVTSVPC